MPSRLQFDLGDSIPASGNLTLAGGAGSQNPATSTCSACVAMSLSAGSANWVVRLTRGRGQGGSLLGTGQGSSMQAGPFLLLQGELLQIEITGATPGASAIGSVYGQQGLRPNEIPPISAVPVVTNNVNATISGGSVGVTDAGLAGAIAQQLSVMTLFNSFSLPANATTTIEVGSGGTNGAYPAQVGSWMLQIVGLAGSWTPTPTGIRIFWQGLTGHGGSVIYSRQRDSSQYIYGSITCTGDVDAPTLSWQITLPSTAPGGCVARLFFSAEQIDDQFYDTAIYGPAFTDYESETVGMDGVLLAINGAVIAANANQTFNMPTYRGAAQIGVQSSQAGHMSVQEKDYTGSVLRNLLNLPISASGQGQAFFVLWLGGNFNALILQNDVGSNTTFFAELRAIKDLV